MSRGYMTEEGRALVFAVDLQDDAHRALLWALRNVYRLGDTIHLVHVAKLKVVYFSSHACCLLHLASDSTLVAARIPDLLREAQVENRFICRMSLLRYSMETYPASPTMNAHSR